MNIFTRLKNLFNTSHEEEVPKPLFTFKYLSKESVYRITSSETEIAYFDFEPNVLRLKGIFKYQMDILNREIEEQFPEVQLIVGETKLNYKSLCPGGSNLTFEEEFSCYADIQLSKDPNELSEQLLILNEITPQLEQFIKNENEQKEIDRYNEENESRLRESIATSILMKHNVNNRR